MLNMLSVRPPSPPASSSHEGAGGDDQTAGPSTEGKQEEIVDLKQALFDEQIVGVELVVADENGPGAIAPRAVTSPPQMTPAERAKHNLTHLPYHPGCPVCAATRRPNDSHFVSHEHLRVVPILVADYCFMKFADEQCLQPVLVMRLYPYKLFFLCSDPQEGI